MGRGLSLIRYMVFVTTPWIIRFAIFNIRTMLIALITMFIGVPVVCDQLANEWMIRAVNAGLRTRNEEILYRLLYLVAFLQYLLGWIFLSYITVWVVGRIF